MSEENQRLQFADVDEDILVRRARELAQQVAAVQTDFDFDKVDYLFFTINQINYALEKTYVQELYSEVFPVRVPCTPTFIRGIVNIRGDILSATDLAGFLGNDSIQVRPAYQMFRLKLDKLELGILVDTIENISGLRKDEIHSFEHSGNARINKYLKGVTKNMINVLDAATILRDEALLVK